MKNADKIFLARSLYDDVCRLREKAEELVDGCGIDLSDEEVAKNDPIAKMVDGLEQASLWLASIVYGSDKTGGTSD